MKSGIAAVLRLEALNLALLTAVCRLGPKQGLRGVKPAIAGQ
jgi:hypothetical protein